MANTKSKTQVPFFTSSTKVILANNSSTAALALPAFADKSFTFVMKTPPATILIKKAAGIQKGSAKPHSDKVGSITRAQAEEIATTKRPDLTAAEMEAAVRTIAGSARSMGITVEGL